MALAFLFPGQGSQSVAMMAEYGDAPVLKATFDEASEYLGEDLWQMVAEGPAEKLAQTRNTQPVMLTASIALWRLWNNIGGKQPDFVAGHSLGEYSALVAAGVLDFKDAVPLTRFRAEAMQNAVPDGIGAMAAVMGLADDWVIEVCQEAAQSEVLEAVNFNANGQVVVAGHKAAIERALPLFKAKGAKICKMLPVSAPFHSSLMQSAAERLKERLENVAFSKPQIPVVNNVDVRIETEPEKIKNALYRQAFHPVQWVKTMQFLEEKGVNCALECGPGKVLTGLVKRCVKGVAAHAFAVDLAGELQ